MLSRYVFACAVALGCHGDDPGFDVVRVPKTAYVSADASARTAPGQVDAAADAHEGLVVCVPESSDPGDETAEDYPHCPLKYEDRSFDVRATERHRKRDDESAVCCYRR